MTPVNAPWGHNWNSLLPFILYEQKLGWLTNVATSSLSESVSQWQTDEVMIIVEVTYRSPSWLKEANVNQPYFKCMVRPGLPLGLIKWKTLKDSSNLNSELKIIPDGHSRHNMCSCSEDKKCSWPNTSLYSNTSQSCYLALGYCWFWISSPC